MATNDQQAIKSFISSIGHDKDRPNSSTLSSETEENKRHICHIEDMADVTLLIRCALDLMIIGKIPAHSRVKIICQPPLPLAKLAPAVLHMEFLQVSRLSIFPSLRLIVVQTIADRSSFLSIISHTLAQMRNAESPTLKEKVLRLADRQSGDCKIDSTSSGDIVEDIKKSLWETIICVAEPPRLRYKKPARPNKSKKEALQYLSQNNEDIIQDMSPFAYERGNNSLLLESGIEDVFPELDTSLLPTTSSVYNSQQISDLSVPTDFNHVFHRLEFEADWAESSVCQANFEENFIDEELFSTDISHYSNSNFGKGPNLGSHMLDSPPTYVQSMDSVLS